MKKKLRWLRQCLCYLLIFSMIISLMTPAVPVNAASNVSLNMKKAKILVGDKVKLSLKGADISKVSSKNKKIATVKKDGTVTGKKKGRTTITVTGSNGKKYKCKVTVRIGLTKKKLYLTKGKSYKIKLKGTAVKSVSSKKKAIAKARKKGRDTVIITAKKKGTVKIKIKGKNKKTYTCKVIVETPSINKKKITLAKGDKTTLKISGTKQKIKWTASSGKIARVMGGTVEALSAGDIKVVATDQSRKTYTCLVKVEEPKLPAAEVSLQAGQSLNLLLANNTQKVKWSSDKKNVVSVDNKGSITAKSEGTARITAKVASGAAFTITIKVTGSVDSSDNSGDKKDNKQDKSSLSGSSKNDDGAEAGVGDREDNGTADPSDTPEKDKESVTVNFMDPKGGEFEPLLVARGTKIGDLPKPQYGKDRTFMGWWYDEDYSRPAYNTDKITENLTLYAKSEDMNIETPEEVQKVTAVEDAKADFSLTIRSTDPKKSAKEILDLITITNVSHKDSSESDNVYQQKENNVEITGSNGVYTLKGKHFVINELDDGFEKGSSYVIKLPELADGSNDHLSFDGQPDSVREYDISIAQKEVHNMTLSDNVVSISLNELEGIYDDKGHDNSKIVDRAYYNMDQNGNTTETEEVSGYFVLKGARASEVKVGNTIALYTGLDPAKAIADPEKYDNNENNHITYLFINKIDGDKYYYGNASITDIIKMPEILPLPADSDLKLDDLDNTLEVLVSDLDWSDDIYSNIKLNADTTVDEGDFIALYKGEYGSDNMEQVGSYQKVESIADGGKVLNPVGDECEYVIINVKKSSLSEIAESADTNYSRPIDAMEYISEDKAKEIEEKTVQDAKESGFVEEAGNFLAKAAMATEGFTSLSGVEGIEGLENYSYEIKDAADTAWDVHDTTKGMFDKYKSYSKQYQERMETYKQFFDEGGDDDDGNVEVQLEDIDASIVRGEHLDGGLGVRLFVEFNVEVTIPKFSKNLSEDDEKKEEGSSEDKKDDDKKDSKDGDKKDDDKKDDDKKEDEEEAEEENKLNINIQAEFLQEVQLSMGFDAKIEWKTIAFIPYPADVLFVPSFTTGTYTGVNVNATAATGTDDGFGDSILEDHGTVVKDISTELKNLLESDGEEDEEDAEDVSNWLAVKYKEMLDTEHDAVTLVEITLLEKKFELFPGIVQFGLELKFQVTVDVVVSLGVEFFNIQKKKTIYTIHVLKGKCTSETIDLIPSELDFKFYVMGFLEIKVGFEIELSLELVEGFLGTASLTVGIGVYLDLYGFFYYHVNILQGRKTENSAGAMYVEIGIYLEVGAGAQIGKNVKKVKGKIASWDTTLYENTFPLKSWGAEEVPLNFKVIQDDIPDIELHQYVTKFVIPDEYFEVTTMTMQEGEIGKITYDDECYGVAFSNNAFVYDPNSHTISLRDGYKEMEAECTATLYYKNGYVPLSHAKMYRTIDISWDNYLDGYAITPYSEGGSYVPAVISKVGGAVTRPKDPVRKGYDFAGWYLIKDENGVDVKSDTKYEFPATMPAESVKIYAKWTPAKNTPYLVRYYLEDPDVAGQYIYDGKNRFTGTTLEYGTPTQYAAGQYRSDYDQLTEAEKVKYQQYEYSPKNQNTVQILPDGSAVLNCYYDIKRSTTRFTTGDKGSAADVTMTTRYGDYIYTPDIAAAGYELTGWKDAASGQIVSLDEIAKAKNDKMEGIGSIGIADGTAKTYIAQWEPRTDLLYRVEYYVQQMSGAYTVQAIDYGRGKAGAEINENAVRGLTVTADIIQPDGTTKETTDTADNLFIKADNGVSETMFDCMTVDGEKVNKAVVKADESTVIKVRYKRNQFTITLKGSGPDDVSGVYTDYTVCAGGKMALPAPSKEGYTFSGYKDETGNDVPVKAETGFQVVEDIKANATYTSKGFVPNTYTVKYDANGGAVAVETQDLTYDVEADLAVPTREGYTFIGWKDASTGNVYKAGEKAKNLTSKENGEVALTAVWDITGYNVTYDLGEGTIAEGANPDTYTPGAAEAPLDYPVREGYTFDGWYVGTKPVVSLPGGRAGDLTITAHWKANEDTPYVVNHYQEDVSGEGKTLVSSETLTGATGGEVTPAVKAYEGFTSPEAQTVTIAADGSTVVEYVYTRNLYNLTINLDGGSYEGDPDTTQYQLPYGAVIETPVKDGCLFAGWTDGVHGYHTMPAEDITLTAMWQAEDTPHAVVEYYKQDLNGEYTIPVDRVIITGAEGDTVLPEIKEYEGFTAPEVNEIILTADNSEPVRIEYDRIMHKVTWDLDGGEAVNEYTTGEVYYEQAITAPILRKENYTYTWDGVQPPEYMGLEDLSFKASWTPVSHRVAFDPAGGVLDGKMERVVLSGEAYGALPTAKKNHAEFTGWYDAKENGKEITADTVMDAGKDHIIYAGWRYQEAEITYTGLEDAANVSEFPTTYKIGEGATIKAPEREGYTFLGWSAENSTELTTEYVIPEDMTENVALTANWKVKTYTLSLYSSTGLYLVKNYESGADLSKVTLPRNTGYKLTGWKVLQTDEIIDSLPAKMPAMDYTLVAQWEENVYKAIYHNLPATGVTMDPITWKIDDDPMVVQPPSKRTGYDFGGWYLSENDCADVNAQAVEKLNPAAKDVDLYARWIPRTYKINYHFNQGRAAINTDDPSREFYEGNGEDNVFTYDASKSLLRQSELGLTRTGYTFKGWATAQDSQTAEYEDGAAFTEGNHPLYTEEGTKNLFAVWSPVTYTISYESVDVGAEANNQDNPVSYNIESGDAEIKSPTGIKEGYQFVGWELLTDNTELLGNTTSDGKLTNYTLKLKGTSGNITLRAKWAYAGKFNLSIKGTPVATPADDGSTETTYTITRTIPAGINVSQDKQRVYFRTVNGTAVGGTVEVTGVGEGAPELGKASANNFKHVGGNGVYALFSGKKEDAKGNLTSEYEKPTVKINTEESTGTVDSGGNAAVDFKVTKERASIRYYGDSVPGVANGTSAHQFNYNGTSTRYYTVELYRIESAGGVVTGLFGTKEVKRTMTMPSNKMISSSIYRGYSHKFDEDVNKWTFITNHRPAASDPNNMPLDSIISDKEKEYYLKDAGTVLSIQISDIEYYVNDHETQMWTYLKSKTTDSGTPIIPEGESAKVDMSFHNFPDDEDDDSHTGHFRMGGTWKSTTWARYDACGFSLWGNKVGGGHADVHYTTASLNTTDTAGPDQVGIAPAATTDYKAGDKVRFSVIYDEVLADVSSPSVDVNRFATYMPLKDVKYVDGKGTNVLVFEGTATKNFSNNTWPGDDTTGKGASGTNAELMKIHPVSGGTVKDMMGKAATTN